ncbi:MAG TPA: methylated-DNA--[protein]-cysteine S-methyltransferase [Rhodothermales bacterium]
MSHLFRSSEDLVYWAPFATPLGTAYVAATRSGICRLSIPNETREHFFVGLYRLHEPSNVRPHPEPNLDCIRQVDEYLNGERTRFEMRLDLRGTQFQRKTWDGILRIPYGTTITYGELAKSMGVPKAYQAVGAAIGQNPVPIVVPCHRVVGSEGSLTGYAAGIETKRWLLRHEGALLI